MPARVLIKGGTVLSLDRAVGNAVGADVLIEDGLITEVGTSLRARGADVVDAADTIVMPGFVDAHRHVWESVLADAWSTARSGRSAAELAQELTPDDVYSGTLVGLLQALEAGITTVVDWCEIPAGAGHLEAVLAAHATVGLRAVVVSSRHGGTGNGAAADAASGSVPADITLAHASPDIVGETLDEIATDWAGARTQGRRIHAHAGTAAAPGGEVAELGRRGLLGADVTVCHCTRLTDGDVEAIARSSTAVALTPASDMAAGAGAPAIQQLLERAVRPGLGAGEHFLGPRDAFAQMRALNSVQRATVFDQKLAGKGGLANLLGTRDVIRYATVDGARAAGLAGVTGSLTPGRRGDVVVLRADRPNIAPVNDPIGAVVWGMDTSNIDWVFVGGRPLVRNGELLADVDRARALVVAAQGHAASSPGEVAAGAGGPSR